MQRALRLQLEQRRLPGPAQPVDLRVERPVAVADVVDPLEFLEWVEYVSGHRYGTLRSEIDRIAARGHVCLLELETEGALSVRDSVPGAVTIFVTAPVDELERRLRKRATESSGEIGERIELARRQLAQQGEFDYVVENDDPERAASELEEIVRRELEDAATMSRP